MFIESHGSINGRLPMGPMLGFIAHDIWVIQLQRISGQYNIWMINGYDTMVIIHIYVCNGFI